MNKIQDNKEASWDLLWLYARIVVILWIIGILVVYFLPSDLEKKGQFGDSFGMLNTLFSGLAFAALLYTIHLQRRQLDDAQKAAISARDSQKENTDLTLAQLELIRLERRMASFCFLSIQNSKIDHNSHEWFCEAELIVGGNPLILRKIRSFDQYVEIRKKPESALFAESDRIKLSFAYHVILPEELRIAFQVDFSDIQGNEYVQTIHFMLGGHFVYPPVLSDATLK